MSDLPYIAHYFVDEAGDLALFGRGGRSLVGLNGASHTFMVGAAEVLDIERVNRELTDLRRELLADPFFAGVPSMSLAQGKTALTFHAKDDVDAVRREVFRLIARTPVNVFVGIRRKAQLYQENVQLRARIGRRRSDNEMYDDLVTMVFKDRLHLADTNHIIFARRGQSERNVALNDALRRARESFSERWGTPVEKPTSVASAVPSDVPGLQLVDYCLWSLQRLYEMNQDRYFNLIADKFRLIIDRDDTRRAGPGMYYTRRNPLTLERLMPVL